MINRIWEGSDITRGNVPLIGKIVLIFVLLLAGCSNPLDEQDTPAAGDDSVEPTAINAPTMAVVTPTPFDPAQATAAPTATVSPHDAPESYVVAEGDTLYSISAQLNVDLAAIVEANNLSDPNDIQVGQELVIPTPNSTR